MKTMIIIAVLFCSSMLMGCKSINTSMAPMPGRPDLRPTQVYFYNNRSDVMPTEGHDSCIYMSINVSIDVVVYPEWTEVLINKLVDPPTNAGPLTMLRYYAIDPSAMEAMETYHESDNVLYRGLDAVVYLDQNGCAGDIITVYTIRYGEKTSTDLWDEEGIMQSNIDWTE